MALNLKPLKLVSTPPLLGKTSASIVFLHGSGDTGPGIQGWAAEVANPPFQFDRVNVVYPTAHLRPYTLLGPHGQQNVWFDRKGLGPAAPEDIGGIDHMSKLVRQVIDEEVRKGVPLDKIILGGFSMGGAMAMHAAFGDLELAAADDTALVARVQALKDRGSRIPPVLQCHGLADPMINVTWGEKASKRLKEAGISDLQWRTYPDLQHELGREEMAVLRKWVIERLGID